MSQGHRQGSASKYGNRDFLVRAFIVCCCFWFCHYLCNSHALQENGEMTLARSTRQSSVDSAVSVRDMKPVGELTSILILTRWGQTRQQGCALPAQLVSLAHRS